MSRSAPLRWSWPWHPRVQVEVMRDELRMWAVDTASRSLLCSQGRDPEKPLETALSGLLGPLDGKFRNALADVTVHDDCACLFSVVPPAGARRLSDLRGAAELRFRRLFGHPVEHWMLEAQWHGSQSHLAAALPRAMLEALSSAIASVSWRIRSITPRFDRHVDTWRPYLRKPGAWFVAVDGDTVRLLARSPKGEHYRQTTSTTRVWAEATLLTRWLSAEALMLDLDFPEVVILADADDWHRAVAPRNVQSVGLGKLVVFLASQERFAPLAQQAKPRVAEEVAA